MSVNTRIVISGQDRGASRAFRNLGKNATRSQRQVFGVNSALKQTDKSVMGLNTNLTRLAGAGGGLLLLSSAIGALKQSLAIKIDFDRINNTLKAVTGTSKGAKEEMGFLADEANRLGLELRPLAGTYTRLLASTKLIGLTTEQTREVFTGFSEALTTFGSSRQQSIRVFAALEQIAAKGCHARGYEIRMYDGSTKKVEDIVVGEELMGADGTPREVLVLARGEEDLYTVTPESGTSFVVNLNHKMRVWDRGEQKTLTVEDYLKLDTLTQQQLTLIRVDQVKTKFNVRFKEFGEFFGFFISGDHLYVDYQGFTHHNTVSMEELRQQLGEALPGAFVLGARAMGKTQEEFAKLVAQGKVLSKDFLIPFTREVRESLGKGAVSGAQLLNRELDRLTNRGEELFLIFAEGKDGSGGFVGGFREGIEELKKSLGDKGIEDSIAGIGRLVGDTFATGVKTTLRLAKALDSVAGALKSITSLSFTPTLLAGLAAINGIRGARGILKNAGGVGTVITGNARRPRPTRSSSVFDNFRATASGQNIGVAQMKNVSKLKAFGSVVVGATKGLVNLVGGPIPAAILAFTAVSEVVRGFKTAAEDRKAAEIKTERLERADPQLKRIKELTGGNIADLDVDSLRSVINRLTDDIDTFQKENDPLNKETIAATQLFLGKAKDRLNSLQSNIDNQSSLSDTLTQLRVKYEDAKTVQIGLNDVFKNLGFEVKGAVLKFTQDLVKTGISTNEIIDSIKSEAEAQRRQTIQKEGRERRFKNREDQQKFENSINDRLAQTKRELSIRKNLSERGADAQIAFEESLRQAAEAGRSVTEGLRRKLAEQALLGVGTGGGTTSFSPIQALNAMQGARAQALQSGISTSKAKKEPTAKQIDKLIENSKKSFEEVKKSAEANTAVASAVTDLMNRTSIV